MNSIAALEQQIVEDFELFDEWSVTTHLFGTRACPGSLCFDDLALTQDGQALFDRQPGDASLQALQTQTRTQVSLSRLTRTARPGHLYNSEYGLPGLSFAGAIYGQVPRLQSIESDIPKHWSFAGALLIAALRSLTRLGGGKSVGAGAVQVQFATEIDEAQQPFEIFSLNGATHRVDAWLSAIPVEVGADYELAREMVLLPQEDNHADAG